MQPQKETLKPIPDEAIGVIFTKKPIKDSRSFMMRLLSSLRLWGKGKCQNGKMGVAIGVKGGVDF